MTASATPINAVLMAIVSTPYVTIAMTRDRNGGMNVGIQATKMGILVQQTGALGIA
jgi:hypothetical protein